MGSKFSFVAVFALALMVYGIGYKDKVALGVMRGSNDLCPVAEIMAGSGSAGLSVLASAVRADKERVACGGT